VAELGGDPARGGTGGDASRLEEPERAFVEESRLVERDRHARRLPRTRRRDDDEARIPPQRRDDLRENGVDRKGRTRRRGGSYWQSVCVTVESAGGVTTGAVPSSATVMATGSDVIGEPHCGVVVHASSYVPTAPPLKSAAWIAYIAIVAPAIEV